jgi:hypothetical protein
MDIVRYSMTCHIYRVECIHFFYSSYCLIGQFGIIRVLCVLMLLNRIISSILMQSCSFHQRAFREKNVCITTVGFHKKGSETGRTSMLRSSSRRNCLIDRSIEKLVNQHLPSSSCSNVAVPPQ